ncbi:predicted protein [Lichtheimia corymbifera JMRC:FSU:9682]|uniref:Uncharacterized protein n=1 Tax=Lichtheimia corymbifera JMRC:FSU:9682 TaxID=1263082 RepID=A0A068RX05_9FUNG|nr:predicted protein [Lichtheimia corymbifera JMRC:FSU:9682]
MARSRDFSPEENKNIYSIPLIPDPLPTTGIEPVTFRLLGGRSAKLSQAGLFFRNGVTSRARQLPYLECASISIEKVRQCSGGAIEYDKECIIKFWEVIVKQFQTRVEGDEDWSAISSSCVLKQKWVHVTNV